EHRARDLAGVRPVWLPVHVLAAHADRRARQRPVDRVQEHRRRADRDPYVGRLPDPRLDRLGQGDRGLGGVRVHLPVARDEQGSHQTVTPAHESIDLPRTSASCRSSSRSRAYWPGRRACGPSERAFSGQEWTSMWMPSHPAATPARAIAGIRSGRPVAWLGSTMIGKWLRPLTFGTIDRSSVFRVESSNVRTPRSQRITWRLPCASTYSADISRTLNVALI